MAFTRKFLAALGIEDDKVEQIITAHTEVTDALKKERDDAQEKAETVDGLQKELKKAQTKLKEYDNGEDSWQAKYEKEKTAREKAENDLKAYKADVEAKETLAAKKDAYKVLLKEAGVPDKRLDTILKVTDFDKIELEDGKIKGSEEVTKSIKTEWADFIPTKSEEGAKVGNPPENNGGTGTNGLSYAAKRAAQHHANLYGATKQE